MTNLRNMVYGNNMDKTVLNDLRNKVYKYKFFEFIYLKLAQGRNCWFYWYIVYIIFLNVYGQIAERDYIA